MTGTLTFVIIPGQSGPDAFLNNNGNTSAAAPGGQQPPAQQQQQQQQRPLVDGEPAEEVVREAKHLACKSCKSERSNPRACCCHIPHESTT